MGRSSAYAAEALIAQRLFKIQPKESPRSCDGLTCGVGRERDFVIDVLKYERTHPGCRKTGESRASFDPDYKEFIEERRAHQGIEQAKVAELLGIPLDTLKKFPRAATDRVPRHAPSELPEEVCLLANEYLRGGRGTKSVKGFCARNPELLKKLGMGYREVLSWLRALGLVSERGIFLKNSGLDRIIRFKPNQLWHGDGKIIDVVINGELFRSVWQCLADGKTTALVGGSIEDQETTEGLLRSIEDAEKKTGTLPMGIIIDNRLSENLPAIKTYLDERGIEIVNTFPGNPKSNSIIEENFNIFDRYIGKVIINGSTPREMARSIQKMVAEIFTQMKNRKPKRSFSNKTFNEVMEETDPGTPEEQAEARQKIKLLADRLKREQEQPVVSAEKKAAIAQAVLKTLPPSLS